MDKYAKLAMEEYTNEATLAHPGGVNGRLYWNINSSQFTFAPSFQFPWIPFAEKYTFTATDRNGVEHSFEADRPMASLAPIWAELPTGFVTVKVVSSTGKISGARTFFKSAPFPGRENLPKRACSYREATLNSYRFIFNDDIVKHWLTHGTPKPDYAHNVYPPKMISSIIGAMIKYAKMSPENAQDAILLARKAADYMLSKHFPEGHPLEGLPPTYCFDGLDAEIVNKVAPAAQKCVGTTMMIYPVSAAMGYLELSKVTNDKKYFDAAIKIANFYKEHLLPEGSWYLLYDCNTGKNLKDNLCIEFKFVEFFKSLYEVTNEEIWALISQKHYKYISENRLKNYNWEGQFEDVVVTENYTNLTHFTANKMIQYICKNLKDDSEQIEVAKDLMRFVEDQFVTWGEFANWHMEEQPIRYTPCGMEQYLCYDPIDASSAEIINSFVSMYRATGERLYLEKAMALADTITRMQDKETGLIPTFFVGENCEYGRFNYWINCQIYTTAVLQRLAEVTEAEGIE